MKENITTNPKIFEDIYDASEKLIEVLPFAKMQDEKWLIVAISFDSIIMANHIANKLHLNFDILFLEPIFAPNNPNYPIAMVSELEEIVMNETLIQSFGIHEQYIYGEAHRKYEEKILPNVYKYKKGELISSLENNNILFIDEGCETGLSALTAIKTAICAKAHNVFFAVPILPKSVQHNLENLTDNTYTLYHMINFVNTDFYYTKHKKIEKKEIKNILNNSEFYLPFKKEQINLGEKEK